MDKAIELIETVISKDVDNTIIIRSVIANIKALREILITSKEQKDFFNEVLKDEKDRLTNDKAFMQCCNQEQKNLIDTCFELLV